MKESNLEEAQAFLKQYKMFSKALNFIDNQKDKVDIYSEMDKLELKILDLTNISYEEELEKILQGKTSFLKEERLKLQRLVDIISSRLDYVNLSLKRHKLSTGNLLATYKVKGEDKLSEYKNNIRIIDKYRENLRNKSELINDVKSLEIKISSAMDRIDSNKKSNHQLEKKMISLLSKVFEEFKCNDLLERRKEINLAYEELGYSLDKARENVRVAKLGNSSDIIIECDNMLSSITLEYERYKEKKYILELIDVYDEEVSDYSELLEKREKINDILKNISNSDVYKEISEELKKQYNTIRMEQQDIDTYNSLCDDKKRKQEIIEEIDKENSSEEFKEVLKEFLDNEKKYREALYLEQQQKEYAERQKKLLRDKEIQEERNRRQKLIEEERNKEIEKRTRELLKQKQSNVIEQSNVKKSDDLLSRVEKNSNVWNEVSNEENKQVKKEEVTIGSRSTDNSMPALPKRSDDEGIPVIKNDKLSSRMVSEDDTFFSSKERQELSSSLDKKESSWF
jgi:hypothetical protein